VQIKLFYDSGSQDDYAELYINIDLAARKLSIKEKYVGYRAAVVQALRAE